MMINKKAQNITEYAIVISLISLVLVSMTFYFMRGIQVIVKEPFDALGWFGAMPVDIENDGLLTNEQKQQKRGKRIQEIGIEGTFDPKYGLTNSSKRIDIQMPSTTVVKTSIGGQRRLTVSERIISPAPRSEYSQVITYDQVTPEP